MADQKSGERKTVVGEGTTHDKKKTNARHRSHRDGLKRSNEDEENDQERPPKYDKVEVLLLTFEFHDLGRQMDKETKHVRRAFKRLGYTVTPKIIPMKKSEDAFHSFEDDFLKKESADTLLIIYYHGHGGPSSNGLVFSRSEPR